MEDENGDSLPTFVKNGRTLLLGEAGLRYNIRVVNPTAERVEAVVSVDGRDTVSGRPADYVHERGYVISPHDSLLVVGFRQSFTEVAAFRFTSPANSYSARRGSPQNVGVIGVAFFPERARPPLPLALRPNVRPLHAPVYGGDAPRRGADDERLEDRPRPASPMQPEQAPELRARGDSSQDAERGVRDSTLGGTRRLNRLGTEFGEIRENRVDSVSFERAVSTHPAFFSWLHYDDAEGLSARGIDLSAWGDAHRLAPDEEPEAFPGSRFAEPPPRGPGGR